MKTYKATAKQMKELENFKAVKFNKGGEVIATMQVFEDDTVEATFEATGEKKSMKLDTVRRGWEVIEEEHQEQLELIEATEENAQETAEAQEQEQAEQEQPKEVVADVTPNEAKVFNWLNEALAPYEESFSDVDVNDIASALKMKVSSVKGIVGSLTKKGYVFTYNTDSTDIATGKKIDFDLICREEEYRDIVLVSNRAEDTAEASETAQEQAEQGQAEQEQAEQEQTQENAADAITLIEGVMQATEQGNQKDFFRFSFRGQTIEVIDYARVTMVARVFQEGSEVFKSKKLSVNDVLVNHFKLEGEELKQAKKTISQLKKGARG